MTPWRKESTTQAKLSGGTKRALAPFLYSGGSYTTLSDPLAVGSAEPLTMALGTNDGGEIVGLYRGARGTCAWRSMFTMHRDLVGWITTASSHAGHPHLRTSKGRFAA